ncbi:MAG: EF-hand domain-containing protein [Alphaproteobacteria bacterium]|nr:EF-hand domain-containing protein [Alphaproteobacteria bacterium]MDE2341157.1 EF-hand domain-containing protein [Alphaproteobacteria bacterium]
MWRFLAGVGAALFLVAGGVLIWRNIAPAANISSPRGADSEVAAAQANGTTPPTLPPENKADSTLSADDFPDLPAADEKTKEQKRFERYDHNHNGRIDLAEFLANTRRAFDKMDLNHDGKLSFEEYAARRVEKFRKADANGDGILTPQEFATTRIKHKTQHCACGKSRRASNMSVSDSEDQ